MRRRACGSARTPGGRRIIATRRRVAAGCATAGLAVLGIAAPLLAQAGDARAAQPERPTMSAHAGTVAPGQLEVEAGLERDVPKAGPNVTVLGVALKTGLGERVQLGVATSVFDSRGAAEGFGDIGVAVKWRLATGHRALGDFAVMSRVTLPTGDDADGTGTGEMGWSLRAISSRTLAGGFHLDANVLVAGPGGGAATQWLWAAAVGRMQTARFGWGAELSGVFGNADAAPSAAFIVGPTFAAQPWLVLDAGAILRVAGDQPRAAYAGVTWNAGSVFRR